ncbi:hypothetical protein BDZ94DRAFT_1277903 [Collybia nuda]|uniref:Uncharacterized protein n=1 Tax=Collybia nuda TaxID=64659 RepID=A0A9P5XTS6_9AGAR|nr:hypothetical protein BDZ94DRAFT_1277903 [Collybia nuda]
MVGNYALENKLDAIIAATPSFVVSEPLMESINSYVVAVLLSAKLSAYKGTVPRDHVLAIIKENKVNIPVNINQDPHAVNKIKVSVQNALMQSRARIKKELKASKAKDASLSIYDLATKIVAATRCSVTVPLCARLALLRKVHTEDDGAKFWDAIDNRLALIRTSAFIATT